jgi:hypothetical protein
VERVRGAARASERSRKEPAMMFAFVLAVVGVVVLGSFEYVAAHVH